MSAINENQFLEIKNKLLELTAVCIFQQKFHKLPSFIARDNFDKELKKISCQRSSLTKKSVTATANTLIKYNPISRDETILINLGQDCSAHWHMWCPDSFAIHFNGIYPTTINKRLEIFKYPADSIPHLGDQLHNIFQPFVNDLLMLSTIPPKESSIILPKFIKNLSTEISGLNVNLLSYNMVQFYMEGNLCAFWDFDQPSQLTISRNSL